MDGTTVLLCMFRVQTLLWMSHCRVYVTKSSIHRKNDIFLLLSMDDARTMKRPPSIQRACSEHVHNIKKRVLKESFRSE
jgi:hypothetical protein